MFFSDRIVSTTNAKSILEVGPGGTPHELSTEFLDIDPATFKSEREALLQRGSAPSLKTDKPITYYDGNKFPYSDKTFDYVIASHVLEHVDDVELFVAELMRVGKKGYIEYPTILYDYLYNIPVHLNFLHYDKAKNIIYYMKKKATNLHDFSAIHDFLLQTLENGHTSLVDSFKDTMFEGFEWDEKRPLRVKKVSEIGQIMPSFQSMHKFSPTIERVTETKYVAVSRGIETFTKRQIITEVLSRVKRKVKAVAKIITGKK